MSAQTGFASPTRATFATLPDSRLGRLTVQGATLEDLVAAAGPAGDPGASDVLPHWPDRR